MNSRWMLSSGLMSLVLLGSYGVVSLLSQEARTASPTSKFGMKLNGGQMDLTIQSPLQISLRASDGKIAKAVDARESGGTTITSYHKDGSRFYSIEESNDGTANLVIMGTDKERVSLQINKDGSIDFKVLTDTPTSLAKPVLPAKPEVPAPAKEEATPAKTEAAAEAPSLPAPATSPDGTGAASILQKKNDK